MVVVSHRFDFSSVFDVTQVVFLDQKKISVRRKSNTESSLQPFNFSSIVGFIHLVNTHLPSKC